jgi:TPR repeat protein
MSEVVDLADSLCWQAFELWEQGRMSAALPLYETSARMGHSSAQIHLGNLMDDHVEPRQPLKAIHWYVCAYRNQEPMAAWNLAMHYVPRGNRRWFRFWMTKAAEAGHEEAITELRKLNFDPGYITVLPFIEQDNDPYEPDAE